MSKKNIEVTDEELVAYLKKGNQKYFTYFVEKYERVIFQKCKSYVKDIDAAKDLTQEILIKVFLEINSFREDARLSTWLYALIHNTCIDYLRKTRRNIHAVMSEYLSEEVSFMADYDEELPQDKSIELLEELLEEMTPEGKLILLLKYKEKQPIKDIQQTLGLSESAVKMRLKRARDILNRLYEQKINRNTNRT